MNPETVPWAAIATGVLAIGAIVTKEVLQMLRSKVEGGGNDDTHSDPPQEQSSEGVDLSIFSNLTQVIKVEPGEEIAMSYEKVDQSDARIERIETEIEVERSLKWAAIQHIRTLYSWIARQGFGAGVPDLPEELAPHVAVPGKEDR